MSDQRRFFRKFYPHQSWSEMTQSQRADLFLHAKMMPRWRTAALVAFTALIASMAGLGVSQRDERAIRHQAVLACDAGWEACRASTGFPVKDAHGCLWRGLTGPNDQLEFLKPGKDGKYQPCPWPSDPAEEAAEDQSSCGVGWDVCFRTAARGGEAN